MMYFVMLDKTDKCIINISLQACNFCTGTDAVDLNTFTCKTSAFGLINYDREDHFFAFYLWSICRPILIESEPLPIEVYSIFTGLQSVFISFHKLVRYIVSSRSN